MQSPVDIVLHLRLESFMGSRFGAWGAARRPCPAEEWSWRSNLEVPALAGFAWRTYDDEQQPHAVGMRLMERPSRGALYEVVEWYGPQDVRLTRWRFQTESGWTQMHATD